MLGNTLYINFRLGSRNYDDRDNSSRFESTERTGYDFNASRSSPPFERNLARNLTDEQGRFGSYGTERPSFDQEHIGLPGEEAFMSNSYHHFSSPRHDRLVDNRGNSSRFESTARTKYDFDTSRASPPSERNFPRNLAEEQDRFGRYGTERQSLDQEPFGTRREEVFMSGSYQHISKPCPDRLVNERDSSSQVESSERTRFDFTATLSSPPYERDFTRDFTRNLREEQGRFGSYGTERPSFDQDHFGTRGEDAFISSGSNQRISRSCNYRPIDERNSSSKFQSSERTRSDLTATRAAPPFDENYPGNLVENQKRFGSLESQRPSPSLAREPLPSTSFRQSAFERLGPSSQDDRQPSASRQVDNDEDDQEVVRDPPKLPERPEVDVSTQVTDFCSVHFGKYPIPTKLSLKFGVTKEFKPDVREYGRSMNEYMEIKQFFARKGMDFNKEGLYINKKVLANQIMLFLETLKIQSYEQKVILNFEDVRSRKIFFDIFSMDSQRQLCNLVQATKIRGDLALEHMSVFNFDPDLLNIKPTLVPLKANVVFVNVNFVEYLVRGSEKKTGQIALLEAYSNQDPKEWTFFETVKPDALPLNSYSLSTVSSLYDALELKESEDKVLCHNSGKSCLSEREAVRGLCHFLEGIGTSNPLILVGFANDVLLKILLSKIAEFKLEETFYKRICGLTDIISLSKHLGWHEQDNDLNFVDLYESVSKQLWPSVNLNGSCRLMHEITKEHSKAMHMIAQTVLELRIGWSTLPQLKPCVQQTWYSAT